MITPALLAALREAVQPEPLGQPLPAARTLYPGARSYCDIEFAAWEGYRPLLLDVHRPAPPGPARLLVYLHGGGWMRGSRRRHSLPVAEITASGFAVACLDYRLSGEAVFPAQLADVHAGLRWLRTRGEDPELDLDVSGVVLWGESAGAHLAALAGLGAPAGQDARADPTGPAIAGVVDWFGPADLTSMGDPADPHTREAQLVGGPLGERSAEARAASPVTHAHRDAPPFLIMHGTEDSLVPLDQSRKLAEALTRAGAEAELIAVPGADHGWFGMDDTGPLVATVLAFAGRHLYAGTSSGGNR
ncbi:alpha/beta hydrolase [Streptomyces sp. AK04-3B]|uniref:alpha/beta hydrolase n=1 Tax=Streptomyces sp. AK04-3B TaxID=3028650 RepID=UPI0029BA3A15|nr:alpha/beta hydrolase [Streptomyces sp. AK04-3B]MDX3802040.1 alpha/beta hydrolase [Streptomyces sp. AK04-3B]